MARLTGLQEVLDNLAKETKSIVGASAGGVLKGALLVMRESQKLTPVDAGNLRNSRFIVSSIPGVAPSIGGGAFKGDDASSMGSAHAQQKVEVTSEAISKSKGGAAPTAGVGYSAVYALSVHENPRSGKTGKPGAATVGSWKFLEFPLVANAARILGIIKKDAVIS